MIEIGKRLIEIKKELDGKFEQYIKDELDYSRRTAYNLIRVANEFSDVQMFAHVTSSKIIALLDMPQEYRDDFISNHSVEDSTVRELKKEIQKYKEALKQGRRCDYRPDRAKFKTESYWQFKSS